MELTCPKCRGAMRQYERSGVIVDQCESCRGIFLDRGELEKLIDAENRFHAGPSTHTPPPPPPPPTPSAPYTPPPPPPPPAPHGWHGAGWHGHHYHGHHYRRRRRSFLEHLFD